MTLETEIWGVAVSTSLGEKIYHVALPSEDEAKERVIKANDGEAPRITACKRTANSRCLRNGELYQVSPGPYTVMGEPLGLSKEHREDIERDLAEERRMLEAYASGRLNLRQGPAGGPMVEMTEDQINHSRRIVAMLEALIAEDNIAGL
jgi:hypothetical protein